VPAKMTLQTGETALHAACRENQVEIMNLLIAKKVDLDAKSDVFVFSQFSNRVGILDSIDVGC
jgi:ankyrin repeat protein